MAYFAKLDENNVVVDLVTVDDNDIQNLPFPESEAVGADFLNSFLPPAVWKQSVDNIPFRSAGVGKTFHPECGEFGGFASAPPADYFVWSVASCSWIPPVAYPTDGVVYYWNLKYKKWSPGLQLPPETTFFE